jgi:hypothetical protein
MYEASLMQKWDYQNGIDFAVRTAVEKTVEKERAKAQKEKEQEKQKEKEQIAKSMKNDKFPIEVIAKHTGLTISVINKL